MGLAIDEKGFTVSNLRVDPSIFEEDLDHLVEGISACLSEDPAVLNGRIDSRVSNDLLKHVDVRLRVVRSTQSAEEEKDGRGQPDIVQEEKEGERASEEDGDSVGQGYWNSLVSEEDLCEGVCGF